MHELLPTPGDIVARTFTRTRFRQGYDQDEVDDHLDALVQAMRARAAGDLGDHIPRASQATGIAFTTTRWRDGYDPDEVDEFLALVQQAMERLEADAGRSSPHLSPTAPGLAPAARPRSIDRTDLVTADDIATATFPTVRLDSGYDQIEVDAYLDRCFEALRSIEHGTAGAIDATTAAEVRVKRFELTTFRDGYDMAAVDAFLARVADALETRAR